jgi:hypothetical protein
MPRSVEYVNVVPSTGEEAAGHERQPPVCGQNGDVNVINADKDGQVLLTLQARDAKVKPC